MDPRILCSESILDSEFTNAVSTFRFNTTFKTTKKARFPLTVQELARLPYQNNPTTLDVGASDGITSLDIINLIPFEQYYVTDLNVEVFYKTTKNTTWFYDENGVCILLVTNKWVIYPDTGGAIYPFNKITLMRSII